MRSVWSTPTEFAFRLGVDAEKDRIPEDSKGLSSWKEGSVGLSLSDLVKIWGC